MKRFMLVNFDNRTVEPDSYITEAEAWKAAAVLAREQKLDPHDWDIYAVEIEPV